MVAARSLDRRRSLLPRCLVVVVVVLLLSRPEHRLPTGI
jgi:hypothetical protein